MPERIAFLDTAAPHEYDDSTLASGVLGGTEATVIRIAEGLARDADVCVAQSSRRRPRLSRNGVVYLPLNYKNTKSTLGEVDTLVVLRCHKILRRIRRNHPNARLLLWIHCFPGHKQSKLGSALSQTDTELIAVSEFHRRMLSDFIRENEPDLERSIRTHCIYNPIPNELKPDGSPWSPDRLVFFSSPHKGLTEVLAHFRALREIFPSLFLDIANPGYMKLGHEVALTRGVRILGSLRHSDMMARLRRAFCVFYPQSSFPETFGLVLVEANAVGTPVLTHPLGAAPEVLGHSEQLVDANNPREVIARFCHWRRFGRPPVTVSRRFRLSDVLASWRRLLAISDLQRNFGPEFPDFVSPNLRKQGYRSGTDSDASIFQP